MRSGNLTISAMHTSTAFRDIRLACAWLKDAAFHRALAVDAVLAIVQ